jgi:PleD family two-component response regulator
MTNSVTNGKRLPSVTASIGVASTPPESRTVEIETVAESRNREAKAAGRNSVIDGPRKNQRKKSA